jgi:hypothetical protein
MTKSSVILRSVSLADLVGRDKIDIPIWDSDFEDCMYVLGQTLISLPQDALLPFSTIVEPSSVSLTTPNGCVD